MLGPQHRSCPPQQTNRADRRACRLMPIPTTPALREQEQNPSKPSRHKARHCRRWTGATGMLARSRDEARPCRRVNRQVQVRPGRAWNHAVSRPRRWRRGVQRDA